jgi:polar amino acid transport system substrate-binding protein
MASKTSSEATAAISTPAPKAMMTPSVRLPGVHHDPSNPPTSREESAIRPPEKGSRYAGDVGSAEERIQEERLPKMHEAVAACLFEVDRFAAVWVAHGYAGSGTGYMYIPALPFDSSGVGAMLARISLCRTLGAAMRDASSLASLRTIIIALLTLPLVGLSPAESLAQSSVETRALRVGVFDAPPFSMKNEDGDWEGLSVELWETVARHRGWAYELREYASLALLLEGVQAGEVDVAPAMASSVALEVAMDLSHSYLPSGSGIALPISGTGFRWGGIFEQLTSWEFVRVIGLLVLVWLTAGAMVWLFERRRNRAMFGGGPVEGLGNGIWWAAVTMTTVGYGDKAPRTLGGRTVAILFMLASIVVISSLTAGITTSLTLDGLSGTVHGVRDLPGLRVGVTAGSSAIATLGERGIATMQFANERDGLGAMVDGQIDAFVFNVLVLRHLARTEFLGRVRVLPSTFDRYHVRMAIPTGSPLREPLNRALLAVVGDSEWNRRVERYIGLDP